MAGPGGAEADQQRRDAQRAKLAELESLPDHEILHEFRGYFERTGTTKNGDWQIVFIVPRSQNEAMIRLAQFQGLPCEISVKKWTKQRDNGAGSNDGEE